MGLKSDSNHFKGTNGAKRVPLMKLNIQLFASFPKNESQIKHILRNDDGHLPNTKENMVALEELTNDENNYVGTDFLGKKWYSKKVSKGQLWASVFNGIISDGGLNREPIDFIEGRGIKKQPILRRKHK